MEKVLTISIAAYNVEQYIEKALDSICSCKYRDYIETFVIDDGGSDRTLEIARAYEKKYPEIFIPVHKENGGYGSTINYTLKHATGNYFKQLDGDDWFDTEGLNTLIEKLMVCDEDVIITGFYAGTTEDDCKISSVHEKDNLVVDAKTYNSKLLYGMWNITYKMEVLKESGLVLPEHTLYSDQIYSVVPFSICKKIRFLCVPVYFYRVGRDGQSTSIQSRKNHCEEMLNICTYIYKFYDSHDCSPYILSRVARYYIVALKTLLIFCGEKNGKHLFVSYERKMKSEHRIIYDEAAKSNSFGSFLKIMRASNYTLFFTLRLIPTEFWHRLIAL